MTDHQPLSPAEIQERIKTFSHWHCQWDFGNGISVLPTDSDQIVGQKLRLSYIFEPICKAFGGGEKPLQGLRVLDIGCNEGAFSIEAKRLGADYVLGIEPRQEKVEQASFIAKALGYENIDYKTLSLWDLSRETVGQFDIVLFVGVLYHLSRPYDALLKVRDITGRMLVIDTQLVSMDYPVTIIKEESVAIATNSYDSSLVQVPSESALRMFLSYAGFERIITLPKPTGREWKRSKVGKRYINGSHGTLLAYPASQDCLNQRRENIVRKGIEEVHSGIFLSLFKPSTFISSARISVSIWAKRFPAWLNKNKLISWLLDTFHLMEFARKVSHRVFN